MYFIFYRTNNVFLAEERLRNNYISCEIVPTPVQDKAYCGICLEVHEAFEKEVEPIIVDIEYRALK